MDVSVLPTHKRFRNLMGNIVGRLRVVSFAGMRAGKRARRVFWNCECECGNIISVDAGNLISNHTLSCGCLLKDRTVKHGLWGGPEYRCWAKMIQRCTNKNDAHYPRYGNAGVSVCERWKTFAAFYEDMGTRPSLGHTLDRFPDNQGNYEPGNVRWATISEQSENKKNTRLITYRGETHCLKRWAIKLGMSPMTLRHRIIKKKMDVHLAFTSPIRGHLKSDVEVFGPGRPQQGQ